MDISNKIREKQAEVEKIAAEEKVLRGRIAELRQLLDEKIKREDSLAALRKEEEELLRQLS